MAHSLDPTKGLFIGQILQTGTVWFRDGRGLSEALVRLDQKLVKVISSTFRSDPTNLHRHEEVKSG